MFTIGRVALLLLATGSVLAAAFSVQQWFRPDGVGLTVRRLGRGALVLALAGGWTATTVLAVAFVTSDWRFAYVSDHARPDSGWLIRLAGVWAGPEGSLLLWSTMVVTAAAVTAAIDGGRRQMANLVAIVVAAGHSVVTVALANPFELLAAPPAGGTGLQPVLEHPAMLWHPPILYAGLIAVMIPAGLVLSASRNGEPAGDAAVRALMAALALLTVGLATGANWAYVELGWGGYWAWDPIENSGLIVWLIAASTIHRFSTLEPPSRTMTVGIVAAAVAAVWATTITRTGLLSSVHSFADQPGLRNALLLVAGGTTAGLVAAAMIGPGRSQAADVKSPLLTLSPAAAIIIVAAAGLIAVGTYQPAFQTLVGGDQSMTGPGFYATVLWPVVAAGAIARVAATMAAGSRLPTVASVVGALAAMAVAGAQAGALGLAIAASGGAVAGAAIVSSVSGTGRATGVGVGVLAHVGIGVMLVGVGGTLGSTTETVQAPIGVVTSVDSDTGVPLFDVVFETIDVGEAGGVQRAVAVVVVDGNRLEPALASYVRSGAISVETATHRGWTSDTQVSLVDADADRAILRVSAQRRMTLIWLGVALMTAGFAMAAIGKHTVGDSFG